MVNYATYTKAVSSVPYGKRLPSALYIFRPNAGDLPVALNETVDRAHVAASPDQLWNVLKLHTDQFALTFLSYPDFDTMPHPPLVEATKINLSTGTVIRTDYRSRPNPPILHRKEAFLPIGDYQMLLAPFLAVSMTKVVCFKEILIKPEHKKYSVLLRDLTSSKL